MAPLLRNSSFESHSGISHNDAFSSERFAVPMKSQLEALSTIPCKTTQKRVRFNDRLDKTVNPENQFYTEDDIATKWWGERNLLEVRHQAKEFCSKLRQGPLTHDCDLNMAHRKITLILKRDFNALLKLTRTSPDQDLSAWCGQDDGRRGLERFISKVYASFRKRDVAGTVGAVLEEQQRQRLAQFNDPELIAQASRTASQRARSLANFFGAADAKQALSKRDSEPTRKTPARKRSKICEDGNIF